MTERDGALLDAQGCLTPAGLAAVAAAPPGQAPAALAAHLAGCPRCQRRLLGGSADASPRAQAPPLWRTGAVLMAVLLLALMAITLMRWLASSGP